MIPVVSVGNRLLRLVKRNQREVFLSVHGVGVAVRMFNVSRLPMSHTCFNQLVLPAYRSRKLLKQKLTIALQNAEGFGLE